MTSIERSELGTLTKPEASRSPLLLALTIIAASCFAWQLFGLRYTTHDDIFFGLHATMLADRKLEFARWVAYSQSRVQAFINMPLILFVAARTTSPWYDLMNLGSALALFAALVACLRAISNLRDALSLTAMVLLLFPLHYFFTFPQGFPVMACWGLCFALLASALLASHIRYAKTWKIGLSVLLFFLSLFGPEFNVILHPVLIAIAWTQARRDASANMRGVRRLFLAAWIAFALVYSAFAFSVRGEPSSEVARLTPQFSLQSWASAALVLVEKGFLPTAMIRGIRLDLPLAQGAPLMPARLSYRTLLGQLVEPYSLGLVFLLGTGFSLALLRRYRPTRLAKRAIVLFLLSILTIPVAILSLSGHYQFLLNEGHLQGHLATFYVQMTMSGLLLTALAGVGQRIRSKSYRQSVQVGSAIILGTVLALTFAYNTVNRQAMNSNMQKWQAVELLTLFVQTRRLDLVNHPIYAPGLWTFSGVSSIPQASPFAVGNYWSLYSEHVLKFPLDFQDKSGAETSPADSVYTSALTQASYFATPEQTPILLLSESTASIHSDALILIAEKPVKGQLVLQRLDGLILARGAIDWNCDSTFCISTIQGQDRNLIRGAMRGTTSVEKGSLRFVPLIPPSHNLITLFFIGRDGAFGEPFVSHAIQ